MALMKKVAFLTIIGVSVPVCYYSYTRWKKHGILQKIISIQCDKSDKTEITCVQKNEWKQIHDLAMKYKIMAVDLEWVQKSDIPIALLQISFPSGHCFLINHSQKAPQNVIDLFTNENIYKIGVGILEEDMKRFQQKWKIQPKGLVDLRHIVLQFHPNVGKLGVQSLVEHFLNLSLDKHWRIRASNWEQWPLTPKQTAYAANDVLTVMAVLLVITLNNHSITNFEQLLEKSRELCLQFVDRKFSSKNRAKSPSPSAISQKKSVKPNGHSTLKKPLYDNSKLEAPDGQLLCVCDSKKAMWYVHKDLGKVIQTEPTLIVRLNFEPAGRPVGQAGDYYLTPKSNYCVVCGDDQTCLRKYIVPHEYRKLFPEVMRDHQSHDVLLMCLNCHQESNRRDHEMRLKLGTICGAPFDENCPKSREDFVLKGVRSAGRALLKDLERNKIPENRKKDLFKTLQEHFNKEVINIEDIEMAANTDPYIQNEDYISHAESVVNYYTENEGILKLEKLWRQHFLDSMKPKFLPENWSIDHQEDRLNVRKDENRIEEKDFQVAQGIK